MYTHNRDELRRVLTALLHRSACMSSGLFGAALHKTVHATRVLHPKRETLDAGNSKSRLNWANTDRGEAQFTASKNACTQTVFAMESRLKVEQCRNGNRALRGVGVLLPCGRQQELKSEKNKVMRTPACTHILHSNIAHIYAVNLVLNLIRDLFPKVRSHGGFARPCGHCKQIHAQANARSCRFFFPPFL